MPLNRSDRKALAESGHPNIKDTDLKTLKKSDPDIDQKLLRLYVQALSMIFARSAR